MQCRCRHVPDVQVVRLGPLEQRGKVTGAKLVERVCRVGCQERGFFALVMASCGSMTLTGWRAGLEWHNTG